MFVDQVRVTLRAGKGGNGCLSFRREKNIPRGGPDGGHGGDGGNVVLVADSSLNSLVYFRFHPINKARRGSHGEGKKKQGKRGEDLVLSVPVGTIVKDEETGRILFDFTNDGQRFLAAKGGKAGRGNSAFTSSINRAPRRVEQGHPGEEKDLLLELKLIADVGLVGFPNVGKSTLISKVSAAKPVVADYPFTTLTPHLGVVALNDYRSFIIADIPGLIKGAHRGQGLGLRFLKHVERTKVLMHVLDVSPYSQRDPVEDYKTVLAELGSFNIDLLQRRQVLVANKIDTVAEDDDRLERVRALADREELPFYGISALTGAGIKALISGLAEILDSY